MYNTKRLSPLLLLVVIHVQTQTSINLWLALHRQYKRHLMMVMVVTKHMAQKVMVMSMMSVVIVVIIMMVVVVYNRNLWSWNILWYRRRRNVDGRRGRSGIRSCLLGV